MNASLFASNSVINQINPNTLKDHSIQREIISNNFFVRMLRSCSSSRAIFRGNKKNQKQYIQKLIDKKQIVGNMNKRKKKIWRK